MGSNRWSWINHLLLSVYGAMLLGAMTCQCQQSTPDLSEASLEQLGSIKVYTASRHLQLTGDAPSSVTIITADEIQRYGYRTLADALRTVRGFDVTYDRNYSSLGVRGFARPGDYNTRILLLVNGHRLNDNVYDEAMLGTEFPLDLELIERIEVIRGPASSLYGSNALFAVINVITRSVQQLKEVELSAEAASFNTYAGRVGYGGMIRNVQFAISQSFYGSRGQNQLLFPESGLAPSQYSVALHADDDQTARSFATLSFRDFTLQGLYATREKGVPTGAYGTIFNNAGTRTTDSHAYLDLSYQHRFANSWDVLARLFYDRYSYQGTYMYVSPNDPAQVSPNLDYADGKWWGTELQASKTIFHRHRITGGGEYRDNLRQNQSNYSLNPYQLWLDDRRNSSVRALYLQDEWSISPSLTANAGLRYDYYNHLAKNLDPRAALIYSLRARTRFKFIYGEAFRTPNVYELYYSIAPNLPNPGLRPEKIHNFELVWEQGVGDRFWLSTSAFYNLMNGLITEEATDGGLIFRNLQNVRSRGLEYEMKAQLTHGLEGIASYSVQNTKDRDSQQFLSNSPRHLAKLNLSQPLLRRKLFLSFDAQYRSGLQGIDGRPIPPFTLVNGTLLGRGITRNLDLSASVYNLLDKRYFDPPSVASLDLPIPQDGRSFRVKLSWRFGEQ